MTLPVPDLDDRTFDQLLADAKVRLQQACPAWTDLSPHDPGIVLLELFAYLTEVLIYRLNRIPEKAYIEFLRLIGVRLQPPTAARVGLTFSRKAASDSALEIPRGTRVTAARAGAGSEAPVFITADAARIEPGATTATALAFHCELVEAELAGTASGLPGFSVRARRPPIIGSTGDPLDLVVAVEAEPGRLDAGLSAREHAGKTYQVWKEVENFADSGPNDAVYVADRNSGIITFAPALRGTAPSDVVPVALAKVPEPRREIRLWYRRGGGPEGNVAAGALTVLKDPIPGLEVTNATPATGGRAAETLENAKVRGPQELHSLQRAVTARDFELVALRSSGAVARAKAFTQAVLWEHASPGTVEVVLVPNPPEGARGAGQVTPAALRDYQTEIARAPIQEVLDERRPLGTTCVVSWARYKSVRVAARVVAHRAEDAGALRQRILDRLYGTISPLPTKLLPSGWPFGQALRATHVYDLLSEPGVADVDNLRLQVAEGPHTGVACITADAFQKDTWYAASGAVLFRSQNNGEGWEPAGRFPDEEVLLVATSRERPGLVAVSTKVAGGSRLHISRDCGETWEGAPQPAFNITDLAWTQRAGTPVLFVAAEPLHREAGGGLFELVLQPGATLKQVLVDPADQNRALYAVAACRAIGGEEVSVAVAAQDKGGVFLSTAGGAPGSFRQIGLAGQDVRVLAIQYYGNRSFLWAGIGGVAPSEAGKGCYRWEIWPTDAAAAEDWRHFDKNWQGGSCGWLAFDGAKVGAATQRAGVLWINDTGTTEIAGWEAPPPHGGLPRSDEAGRPLQPVDSVGMKGGVILAGGPKGVYRSSDGGSSYDSASQSEFSEFSDKVTLPDTWLFCSDSHEIEVISQDEARAD